MKTHPWSRRRFLAAGVGASAAFLWKPSFAASQDLAGLSLKKASDLLRSKGASPVDLVRACLERIDRYNPSVNAFITVTADQALATAREMEAEQRRGKWRGPLHGIPIAFHARFLAESPNKYQQATRVALQGFAETNAAVYVQARRQVDLLRRGITSVFAHVDLLMVPTMLVEPVTIADSAKVDAVDFRNTVPFNTYGLPAISIPCGFTRSGLPIGLQISGPPFSESTVLALAHAYEQATAWHSRRPNMNPA